MPLLVSFMMNAASGVRRKIRRIGRRKSIFIFIKTTSRHHLAMTSTATQTFFNEFLIISVNRKMQGKLCYRYYTFTSLSLSLVCRVNVCSSVLITIMICLFPLLTYFFLIYTRSVIAICRNSCVQLNCCIQWQHLLIDINNFFTTNFSK